MHNSKPCKKCGQIKPLIDFHKNPLISDGHKNSCKACESEYYKDYRLKKPRVVTQEQKSRWQARRRKRAESGELRRYKSNWYQNNKEKHRGYTKAYRDANPGLNAHYVRKYLARKNGNGVFSISKKEIARLRAKPCFYCNKKSDRMTIDHVIPLSRGGRHSIGNLVSCCQSCNSRKRTKFIMEWRKSNATN